MDKLIVYEEPRVNIVSDLHRSVVVEKGGQRTENVSEVSVNYGQSSPMTNAQWSVRSPNNQCVLDRNVFITWYLETKTDQPLVFDTYDCLRSHPMASVTESLNVKINGSGQATKRVGNLVHLEENFMAEPEQRRCAFMAPSQPDNFGDLFNGNFGFNRNPAAGFGENVNEDTRGSFRPIVGEENILDGGLYRNRWAISEALNISPFKDLTGHQSEGMTNINDLYINYQFKSLQDKVLSCMPRLDPGSPADITQVNVKLWKAPELKLTWITPLLMDMIPPVQTLSYVEADDHYLQRSANLSSATQELVVESETYSISQVPSMLVCGVRLLEQDERFTEGSAFYKIKGVRVVWNNQGTLLDQSSPEQIYQMCRRNGLNRSYQQWSKSSVLMLKFGKDIGLPDGLSAGTVGNFTIKVILTVEPSTVRLTNGAARAGYEACFVMYQSGTAMIAQNSARFSLGLLTPAMTLAAEEKSEGYEQHNHEMHATGNGFAESLAQVIKRVKKRPMAAAVAEAKPKESRKIGGGLLSR